jgi:hypothetical protein
VPRAVVHGLARVRDPASKDILRVALGSSQVNLRPTAAWGLAQIADANSAGELLNLADGAWSFERVSRAALLTAAPPRPAVMRQYDDPRAV